jgi:glucan phosphoethanolaminetransferase (alkaline phosphatase superfamily)
MTGVPIRNNDRPMWALERPRGPYGPQVLRLGASHVMLDDVAGFDASAHVDRDRHGRFVSFFLFAVLGCLFTIGVIEFGWRKNYLLAIFILFSLAAMSFGEIWFLHAKRYTVFNVHLNTGETIVFTTHDGNSAAALHAVLSARR